MPETMKKAPKIGALEWNLLFSPPRRARLGYFFFFAGAFFLVAAFLVALFIDLFSLTSNFATRKKSQCDSYIRFFEKKVKRKMHFASRFGFHRVPSVVFTPQKFCSAGNLARGSHSYIQLGRAHIGMRAA
jgi:hypothetical protein